MNLFKIIWVDNKGRLWSAMKGQRGFYRDDLTNIWRCNKALRYHPEKVMRAAINMRPYLFAFRSLAEAREWVSHEFNTNVTNGTSLQPNTRVSSYSPLQRFNSGCLQVWHAIGTSYDLEKLREDMYDDMMISNAPRGTVFCKSLKLISPTSWV